MLLPSRGRQFYLLYYYINTLGMAILMFCSAGSHKPFQGEVTIAMLPAGASRSQLAPFRAKWGAVFREVRSDKGVGPLLAGWRGCRDQAGSACHPKKLASKCAVWYIRATQRVGLIHQSVLCNAVVATLRWSPVVRHWATYRG